jgi:flagellin-like protein
MKKIWAMRKETDGVSPVIATILMVAITVVLAAVLYVMVLGIGGPGTSVPAVACQKGSNSTYWTFTVISISGGSQVLKTEVNVQAKDANGAFKLTTTALTASSSPYTTTAALGTNGVTYQSAAGNTNTYISVGDTFGLLKSTYAISSTLTLLPVSGSGSYAILTVTG